MGKYRSLSIATWLFIAHPWFIKYSFLTPLRSPVCGLFKSDWQTLPSWIHTSMAAFKWKGLTRIGGWLNAFKSLPRGATIQKICQIISHIWGHNQISISIAQTMQWQWLKHKGRTINDHENASPLAAIINWLLCMQISSVRYFTLADSEVNVINKSMCEIEWLKCTNAIHLKTAASHFYALFAILAP